MTKIMNWFLRLMHHGFGDHEYGAWTRTTAYVSRSGPPYSYYQGYMRVCPCGARENHLHEIHLMTEGQKLHEQNREEFIVEHKLTPEEAKLLDEYWRKP